MFSFFKKKKPQPQLFGTNIEPNCSYCALNLSEDDIVCQNYKDDVCSKYEYDPLKRKPQAKISLKEYKKKDFSL